jgi:hypothetical protein
VALDGSGDPPTVILRLGDRVRSFGHDVIHCAGRVVRGEGGLDQRTHLLRMTAAALGPPGDLQWPGSLLRREQGL